MEKHNLQTLQTMARSRHIVGFSRMRKGELLQLLQSLVWDLTLPKDVWGEILLRLPTAIDWFRFSLIGKSFSVLFREKKEIAYNRFLSYLYSIEWGRCWGHVTSGSSFYISLRKLLRDFIPLGFTNLTSALQKLNLTPQEMGDLTPSQAKKVFLTATRNHYDLPGACSLRQISFPGGMKDRFYRTGFVVTNTVKLFREEIEAMMEAKNWTFVLTHGSQNYTDEQRHFISRVDPSLMERGLYLRLFQHLFGFPMVREILINDY